MPQSAFALLTPALLLVAPATLTAQGPSDALVPPAATSAALMSSAASAPSMAPPTSTAPLASGPIAEGRTVALRSLTAPAPTPRAPRGNSSDNRALMIVGGVGLLVGAVIGGDAGTLVMLGSAGVGLWGLYRYLN